MAKFVKVATTGELTPGQAKKVEVDGKVIALFNLDKRLNCRRLYVFDLRFDRQGVEGIANRRARPSTALLSRRA